MKIHWIIFVLCVVLLSFSYSDGAKQKKVASSEEQELDPNESSEKEAVNEEANPLPRKSSKKEKKQRKDSSKGRVEHKAKKEKVATNDTSVEDLKEIFSKMNKTELIENESNDTKTPYEIRHYLTAEQKYYLLRMNLLGIGIYVVHDIIPIPISSTDQYTRAMGLVLERVEATRPAAANATKHGMHNITIEDADRLHKSMSPKHNVAMKSKMKNYTTEILIFGGIIAAVILIGVLVWACKKGQESSKRSESYYDPLQPGSGLAMN